VKILVPVKQVMDVELNVRVAAGKVVEDGMTLVLSKWDENALEAAVQLKEAGTASEVVVVTVGPESAGETLRKAMAMGADRAVHVLDPAADGSDSLGVARVLAALGAKEKPDLILAGLQAQDTDMGGVGPMTAELMGIPCLSNVTKIEGTGPTLTIHRRGDQGREVIAVTLPALITANDSLNQPRLASLKGIMMAKKKPMDTLTLENLGAAGVAGAAHALTQIAEFQPPAARAAGRKFTGEPEVIAKEVFDLLVKEAKLVG